MDGPDEHRFFDRRLRLRQSVTGHRAGAEAVLLAKAVPESQTGLILDIGAGAGAVGLGAALRAPAASVGLVEIDPEACALARENVAANGLAARVAVYEADLLSGKSRRAAGLVDERASLVLTNPPFYDVRKVRVAVDPRKARAHVATTPLAQWVRASLALLAPGGSFVMIHRADALADCLLAVQGRLGGVTVQAIHSRPTAPAIRILITGVKGSKAPSSILLPLIADPNGRKFQC